MSDPGFSRRKQQLLDKFLAGEIDKAAYDSLLAHLDQLEASSVDSATPSDPPSGTASSPSFVVTESRTSAERSAYASPVALLEAGMDLGGFQLKRRLRRGGMGEVWLAYDATGERTVVIKVLPPELQRSPDEMARVKQTFNRVHNLQHQHICPVYLLGQDSRFGYFIVMKYLEGDTLSAYRKAYTQDHKSFPWKEVVRVLTPVAQALDYAHGRQIIHRDIKPQNIMLDADGQDVQLVDFGLAAEVRTSVMRVSQAPMETCGTYPYMAPEQWRGETQDARTDQYALAVVAFELLAGHLPFEAADPTVLRMCVLNDEIPKLSGQPASVNKVIARGMSKSRTDRFPNCMQFVKALSTAAVESQDLFDDDSDTESKRPSNRSGSRPIPLSSRPSTPSRRGRTEDADDVELFDADDEQESGSAGRGSRTSGKNSGPRTLTGTRAVKGEAALERANASAMFWVALIGSSVCMSLIGLFGWVLWTGMNLLPGQDQASKGGEVPVTPVATNPETPNATPGDGIAAVNPPPDVPKGRPEEKNLVPLRYQWAQGKQYGYSVKVEMEPDPDVVLSLSGNVTYSRGQPVAKKNDVPDGGKGTGTGFVVHAGGYLVTCQHVVDDASEIEVAIGGKNYPARVVIADVEHDLAIIKIEANGLPTLPLADSDQVQLGEEVRAIGFPFSSILGANVKATRGTISGINQEDDRKVFQVDAGINPGNSGGPLVNDRGDVIGVNFAKLRDEVATNVGFAVPINDATLLLKNEGIAFSVSKGNGPKLEGPDLVKRISAATALITVNTGGGPAAGLHHYELHCQGSLNSSLRSKSGKPVDTAILAAHNLRHVSSIAFSHPDIIETDPLGHVHDVTGDRNPLPGYLGPVSMLVLEQFPSLRRASWTHSFPITVVISEGNGDAIGPPSRFRPRFRPPGFPGFPQPGGAAKTTRLPGKVRIQYSLQDVGEELVKIKKEFKLEAGDPAGKDPRIKMTGTGLFTFDLRAGIPRSLDYSATLVETEPNKTTQLPIKVSYQLVDERAGGNVALAPAAAMQPGKLVEKDTALPIGTRLVAEWAGKWLPVDVLELKPDNKVRIHWVGWNNQFDEDVDRARLRFPIGVNPPAADPPVVANVPHEFTQKLTAAEIDQCLVDIQGANAGQANLAASRLQHAIPLEEKRDAVLKVLETLLKDKDQFRRKQAVEGFANWAREESIPLLIQTLEDPALLVKLAVIDTLGKLKDGRAAEPLAKLVSQPGPRVQAANALQMLGVKAEPAVLGLLTNSDPDVRKEACRLLKDVGTIASLPALDAASEDAERNVANSAKEAAAAIRNRK
jgi:serine/threonine protein kinase